MREFQNALRSVERIQKALVQSSAVRSVEPLQRSLAQNEAQMRRMFDQSSAVRSVERLQKSLAQNEAQMRRMFDQSSAVRSVERLERVRNAVIHIHGSAPDTEVTVLTQTPVETPNREDPPASRHGRLSRPWNVVKRRFTVAPREPDRWLHDWAFLIPKRYREDFLGDLIADRAEMRKRGDPAWRIAFATWSQMLFVLLNLPKTLLGALVGWVVGS